MIGSAKGGFGLWPKLERERESARWWRTVEMGGRPVVAPSQLGGRRLPWFGSAKEKREERRARERERCVGMIDERENEWRGVYIIPSPR